MDLNMFLLVSTENKKINNLKESLSRFIYFV